jgi:exo-beta-1,3-glucanase (GH17 family)
MVRLCLVFCFIVPVVAPVESGITNRENSNLSNDKQNISMTELRKNLMSGQVLVRQDPFVVRKFNPFIGDKWIGNGVSYGCYRKGQAPGKKGPTKEQILEDLNIVSQHWNLIRIYNSDDDTERILQLIREYKFPIRMMLGAWLDKEQTSAEAKESNIKNVLRCIELANRFKDIVIAVNVGNETQVYWSGHKMNSDNLIRYIRTVRNNVSVPVTTADDYNFWNKPEGKRVADEIDFIVTHIYPLWNGQTLNSAIPWMDSTYQDLQRCYAEKQIVLGETGWATQYNPDKKGPGEQGTLIKGEVGYDAQEKYLTRHNQWVNQNQVTTFLFEAFDEPWKGGGTETAADEIEKHWGVFYENRRPKPSFRNYLEYEQIK